MSKLPKLFWIGSPFFSSSLAAQGWEVYTHNFEHPAVFDFERICELSEGPPDVVVVADKSRPPFVLGMENFPCLTIFYCVDSHIHSWYPLFAQAFDFCLISLRDHMPLFTGKELHESRLIWSPPYARDEDAPLCPDLADESGKDADCLFVGSINAEKMPKRSAFLHALGRETPGLVTRRGDYRKLFAQGKVLLNHCEGGDLNFRVFEALGCGGCLLTPRVGHGLEDIFMDGQELALYNSDDARNAAARLETLLGNPVMRAAMRKAGLQAVDSGHRARHRAQNFTRRIQEALGSDIVARRLAKSAKIRETWLKGPYLLMAEAEELPLLKKAYLAAARGEGLQDLPKS